MSYALKSQCSGTSTLGLHSDFENCVLQLLLRKKAAEELKKEQERKAAERRKVIDERCGKPKNVDGIGDSKRRLADSFWLDECDRQTIDHAGALMAICKEYHDRVMELEGQKWDLERSCKIKVLEVI